MNLKFFETFHGRRRKLPITAEVMTLRQVEEKRCKAPTESIVSLAVCLRVRAEQRQRVESTRQHRWVETSQQFAFNYDWKGHNLIPTTL